MLTPADYIAAQQRQHPPIYQTADGGREIFDLAVDYSSPKIQSKVTKGSIAGGEVGVLTPVAYVTETARGYGVVMHSGLMRLIYNAASSLTSTDDGKYRGGELTPALSGQEAAAKVAELFMHYKEEKIAKAQIFSMTQIQQSWADTFTIYAITYLLMHELAHIYNEHSFLFWWPFRKKRDILELEIQADSTASQWLIGHLLNSKLSISQRQLLYAGAEFGLRVRMAMETTGMRFERTHPTAGDRIAALRAKFRTTSDSRTFYRIANTSLAFDQMWRSIEKKLLHQPPGFEFTLDDVLSSMRTLVDELLSGDRNDVIVARPVAGKPGMMQLVLDPKEPRKIAMISSAHDYMARVSPDIRKLTRARALAGDVYEPGTAEFSILLALLNTVQP